MTILPVVGQFVWYTIVSVNDYLARVWTVYNYGTPWLALSCMWLDSLYGTPWLA